MLDVMLEVMLEVMLDVMLVRVAGAARRTARTCSPHPDATLNDHGFAPLTCTSLSVPGYLALVRRRALSLGEC